MSQKIILVGGFHEIIEICELSNLEIVGIIDDAQMGHNGYPVLGSDSDAEKIKREHKNVPVFISPDSPRIRKKLATLYESLGFEFISIVHPSAIISSSAKIGRGVVIHAGVSVSCNSYIGDFVKINSCANITHDVEIHEYSTIAPSAVILSHTVVHSGCYIGANSTILPNKVILSDSVVGAGAVVTKNVASKLKVIGNPANVYESTN